MQSPRNCGLAKVNRYVVIDDEDECLDELPLKPSAQTGFTQEIADGVARFLAGRSMLCS